jgi:hypothetical protein
LEHAVELALHFPEPGFLALALRLFSRREALALLHIGLQEPLDRARVCQLRFQGRQDAALDRFKVVGFPVRTTAALVHP